MRTQLSTATPMFVLEMLEKPHWSNPSSRFILVTLSSRRDRLLSLQMHQMEHKDQWESYCSLKKFGQEIYPFSLHLQSCSTMCAQRALQCRTILRRYFLWAADSEQEPHCNEIDPRTRQLFATTPRVITNHNNMQAVQWPGSCKCPQPSQGYG